MVSRRVLPRKIEEQVYNLFYQSLANLNSQKEVEQFLKDLLSPTERLMLSKRLAIALLLVKGYDFRGICQALKVSQTTVAKVNYWLRHGGRGYQKVANQIISQEKWQKFWQKLIDFISEATEAKVKFPQKIHSPKGVLGEEYPI